jgi:phosphocarrier protein
MQMMLLAATQGTKLEVIAIGEDAQSALDALAKLVDSGFGED